MKIFDKFKKSNEIDILQNEDMWYTSNDVII